MHIHHIQESPNKMFLLDRRMMRAGLLILTTSLMTYTETVLGSLTVLPRDTQVMVGHSTKLTCSTNNPSREIYWNYYPVGLDPSLSSSRPTFVYRFGEVINRFRDRFQVERNGITGATNLLISQLTASDAGTYECQDNDGAGDTSRAQLIALEPKPICKFNAKSNAEMEGCGNDPEELELHCNVFFAGNSIPSLEWRKLGETSAIREGIRVENSSDKSISLILTLSAALNINRSSFICLTSISQVSASSRAAAAAAAAVTAAQYNCSSDGTHVTCQSSTETNGKECKSRPSCRPTVSIRIFTKLTNPSTATPVPPSQFPVVPVVIAFVIAVLIGAIAIGLIFIWRRHRMQIQTMVGRAEQLAFRRAPERICYRDEPIAIHTIRFVHADERQQREIRGVTALGQDIFVVSSRCMEIVVYDSADFTEKRRFDLHGLIDAWDIVSCPTNDCLYVMDGKGPTEDKEIIRFEANGDVKSYWSTKRKAGYLSVARDGKVVLAVCEKNVVVEYSPEGKKLRKIRIISIAGEIHPHHAFKLETGHYLAIHGIGDNLHRACIVNEDTGALVKSFGGKKGSGDGNMNLPKYIAVDGAGSVMVLDQNNNRVLLLGFDLQYQAELVASRHGLLSPRRIHLNEPSGRLYVAQSDSILIFDILQRNAVMPIL